MKNIFKMNSRAIGTAGSIGKTDSIGMAGSIGITGAMVKTGAVMKRIAAILILCLIVQLLLVAPAFAATFEKPIDGRVDKLVYTSGADNSGTLTIYAEGAGIANRELWSPDGNTKFYRLILDLKNTYIDTPGTLLVNTGSVLQVRYAQFDSVKTRFVMDLTEDPYYEIKVHADRVEILLNGGATATSDASPTPVPTKAPTPTVEAQTPVTPEPTTTPETPTKPNAATPPEAATTPTPAFTPVSTVNQSMFRPALPSMGPAVRKDPFPGSFPAPQACFPWPTWICQRWLRKGWRPWRTVRRKTCSDYTQGNPHGNSHGCHSREHGAVWHADFP
jgi:hypothetical protein